MAALSNSLIPKHPDLHFSYDIRQGISSFSFGSKVSNKPLSKRTQLVIQASYSDDGRSNSGSAFVGGFIIGGLVIGSLGCIFAPQISRALAGTDRKDLMKKLPKFIYDEEKVLEKQRRKLAEKIEQLNLAIDNVSTQLRSEEPQNGSPTGPEDIQALI